MMKLRFKMAAGIAFALAGAGVHAQNAQYAPGAEQGASGAARYYVAGPDTAPSWGLRFSLTLLFSK